MVKPSCFGSYHPNRVSPCAHCHARSRCSSETPFHSGFSVLHHPRYAEDAETIVVADPEMDAERLARAVSCLVREGFQVEGNWALMGTKSRFARVCLTFGRISAKVKRVSVRRVHDLEKADRFDIRTWRSDGKGDHTRRFEEGVLILASSEKLLASFLRELAISIQREE